LEDSDVEWENWVRSLKKTASVEKIMMTSLQSSLPASRQALLSVRR